MSADLDVITIGRCSVDLYGQQIGSRLEDIASFAKSVGGCPSNIAIGTARLGLKPGLITRVGDEQMGRYVLEQMQRENVCVDGIGVDPDRLTALVLLSVEDDETFPLIFYRENCADMALSEADISADFISRAKAVLVSGTHFSKPGPDAAQRRAIRLARESGRKVIFDVDYRPNLWGLAGHAAGEERYVRSDNVSKHLQTVLPDCDLIVGTEEEIFIASGEEEVLPALRRVRELSHATIVLKRGPMGCVVYPGAIPDRIEDGIVGTGFPIEVYNVLGAGDAFMSGFLRGWLRDEPYETCATWANACGAFAVSRLLCSPESPTFDELTYFLEHGSPHKALRRDEAINHVHWATTRRPQSDGLVALALDHRSQLEEMARSAGAPLEKINAFKRCAVRAAAQVADGRDGFGMLLDDQYGREALFDAAKHPFWIGRPVEEPGSRPLRFQYDQDIGGRLAEWPITHTVKCLVFYHPDDEEDLKTEQAEKLAQLYRAVRRTGHELLVEVIAGKHGTINETTIARALGELYDAGIKPDWWKLEAQNSSSTWASICALIRERDSYCRGIVVLGLDAPADELAEAFSHCAGHALIKGFAVGRTIFAEAARAYLSGETDGDAATEMMAKNFTRLVGAWPANGQS